MLLLLLILYFVFLPRTVYAADVDITAFSPLTTDEWVQITNNTSERIILENWKFIDSSNTQKSLTGCIEAGKSRTFQTGTSWLNNDGDTISLVNSTGGNVASISYAKDLSIGIPAAGMAWYYNKDSLTWQEGASTNYVDNTCTMPTSAPTQATSPSPTQPTTTPTPTNTPKPTPAISIETFPSTASVMQSFAMRFTVSNLSPDTEYTFKAIGGLNDKESMETYNSGSWYGYRDAWDNHPKFKSGSDGKLTQSISMRVKDAQEAGEYKVQIRIKEIDKDSDIKYISIKSREPTATITPTSSHTPTPTPEDEEGDFFADQESDNPDLLASLDTVNDVDSYNDQILGAVATPTPTPAPKSFSSSVFPLVLMITGALLLITPLVITKIKGV